MQLFFKPFFACVDSKAKPSSMMGRSPSTSSSESSNPSAEFLGRYRHHLQIVLARAKGPLARCSKVPKTFRARKAIRKNPTGLSFHIL